MQQPRRREFAYALSGAAVGFFIAWGLLYVPPAKGITSLAQCVLDEMKGRPEHLLPIAATACRERQQAQQPKQVDVPAAALPDAPWQPVSPAK